MTREEIATKICHEHGFSTFVTVVKVTPTSRAFEVDIRFSNGETGKLMGLFAAEVMKGTEQ